MIAGRAPSSKRKNARMAAVAAIGAALAGCTAILGFDKDVVEQGRASTLPDGGDPSDAGGPPSSSTDGAAPEDGSTPPDPETEVRGILDPSFGDKGTVSVDVTFEWSTGNAKNYLDDGRLAIDSRDRIVVSSTNRGNPWDVTDEIQTQVFRLSREGALDSDFGEARDGGFSMYEPPRGELLPLIAARPDDGIALAGYRNVESLRDIPYGSGKSVVRGLTSDGDPDPAFGDAGVVWPPLSGGDRPDRIAAMAEVGDRWVMAFVTSFAKQASPTTPRGSGWVEVDRATGAVGRLATPNAPSETSTVLEMSNDIIVLGGDRAILVGNAQTGSPGGLEAVMPFLWVRAFDGTSIDTNFGDAGSAYLTFGKDAKGRTGSGPVHAPGVISTSGRIFLVGATTLSQVESDGRRVTDLGDAGVKTLSLPLVDGNANAAQGISVFSAAFDPNGKIIVGGRLHTGISGSSSDRFRPFLVRLTPDGEVDPTFGDDGWVLSAFGTPFLGTVTHVLFTPKGRLLATGATYDTMGNRTVFVKQFR